ncbi:gamma-tubulin complex component 5-like [Rhynchophorus ferrugineus]|uniref:gamma-tubulin complex component 5-like n=1 Tax=Rhynchophorus ferrugineus TaxID=354439 RepID=UPI003FCE8EF3
MSRNLSDDVTSLVKELIHELSDFEESSAPFHYIYKYFTTKLKKSDTMYFSNRRDIDQNISSMAEKFCFHGFFQQAEELKSAYKMYLPENLLKSETMNRLNNVKFLLCMSDSPTKYFLEHPEMVDSKPVDPVEEIDWGEYLNEGVDTWNPNFEETSDEESFSSLDENDCTEVIKNEPSGCLLPVQIQSSEKLYVMDFRANREELLNTIQHSWYNGGKFFIKPQSKLRDANIGILWESYLRDQVHGLINIKSPSFTTEYKVLREILWQLWCPHTSSTIELIGNDIISRPDITLASVRSFSFYNFMHEFIQYIELLNYFRKFQNLLCSDLSQNNYIVARTYQCYSNCLSSIIKPVYEKLCNIEDEVKMQETTYTLLRLTSELSVILEPVRILKQIHEQVILNPEHHQPLECATTLIVKLHETLHFTTNKLEQDIKIAMFLESVQCYLNIVDTWFTKDELADYTNEFLIEKKLNGDWHSEFVVRENVNEKYLQNSFLKIFKLKVLKIGKNINFLRLLGKYDIIADIQGTIYEEYIKRVLKKLEEFYKTSVVICKEVVESIEDETDTQPFIYPVIGDSKNKTVQDMERLENIVDVDDGFLMTAFSDFFINKPKSEDKAEESLYNKISKTTSSLYPKTNIFDTILSEILHERFTISGLMVKNLLIEEHLLEKQFEFLKRVYLFYDDMIYPFYLKLFEKTESSSKNWANDIWLTSHLQDIFMDVYPEFYEKCSVQVKDGWSVCMDSLSASSLINIYYEIWWPLNIIITPEQIVLYQEIFQFLLKLKWALHTLNHLVFSDLESRHKSIKKSQKTYKASSHKNKPTAKLIRLKFYLINVLNSLQHFIWGFVFSKNLFKYELEFEKAHDLNSLIDAHDSFIRSVSGTVKDLKERTMEKDKVNNVLSCVKLLKLMWNDLKMATPERISDCKKMYESFYSDISPIIFPVYIYDY